MKFFEPHESLKNFCENSRKYFFEGYQVIAKEVNEWFGLSKLTERDTILEFGGGEGFISIFLSKLTPAKFIYLDKNPLMAELARKNFEEAGITDRVKIVVSEVEKAQFEKNSMDFIIARGTIQFTDYKKTLSNAVDWIKPGRVAFVGCGFGLNISDEYSAKVDEFIKKAEAKEVNTEPDKFEELIIEGYRHLMDNYFDDCLEYVKALNMKGFIFEIKKSARCKK